MTLLIDTYNVLHVMGVLPPELAGLNVHGLAGLIRTSRYGRRKSRLVCDGTAVELDKKPDDLPRTITTHFAGPTREADDVIREMIEQSSSPKRLLVVSSDRAVRTAARKRRCRVLDAPTFLRHIAEDAAKALQRDRSSRPFGPLTTKQVEQWIRHFKLAEDELAIPTSSTEQRSAQPSKEHQPSTPHSPKISKPSRQRTKKPSRKKRIIDDVDDATTLPPDLIDEADQLWNERSERSPE